MPDNEVVCIERYEGEMTYGYWKGKNFIRHRLDGPCHTDKNGITFWRKNGKFHRIGGPAVYGPKSEDGKVMYEKWIVDGQCHRDDGPAFTYDDGLGKRWFVDGEPHREDGPAIETNGKTMFFITGVAVPENVVMEPELQTIEEIMSEKNMEIKRIRIDRFGWTNFIEETNAKIIDRVENDIQQTSEFLCSAADFTIFVGACPSTARVYAMEVPEKTKTCSEAKEYLSQKDTNKCVGAS